MYRLTKILREEVAPAEIEELDGIGEVKSYLNELNIEYDTENVNQSEVMVVGDPKKYIVEFDGKFPVVSEIERFLKEKSRPGDFYEFTGVDFREYYTNLFWDNVGKISEFNELYHATKEQHADSILKNGLEARKESRIPMSRIHRPAVFTVKDLGYLADETYGSAVIVIDTMKMKKDSFTPDVGREKDFERKDMAAYLIDELNLYIPVEQIVQAGKRGTGSWRGTVAIYSDVPPKYITQFDGS